MPLPSFTTRQLTDHSGPVISPEAKTRIESYIASVEEEGGKILLDGRGVTVPEYPDGNFVGPTIVECVTTMKAYQ
jgi:malonate-semialdehyde dehydrogenase (acetylating)/methylmalonate-semialdehyde dehydrogenase